MEVRAHIRAAGFGAAFADFDWMREHSSDEEWEDLLSYERAFAREVMFSKDTSAVRLSDPGDYAWVTPFFEERTRRRFKEHGPVESLFFDPARRHLIELTAARQRLSAALEGLTEEALEAREQRYAMFDRARAQELASRSGPIAEGMAWWSQRLPSPENLRAFFSIELQALGTVSGSHEVLVSFPLAQRLQLGFELRQRIDVSKQVEGAFIVKFFVREGEPFSEAALPDDDELLPLAFALPNSFLDYSQFQSKQEYSLAATAWRYALRLLIEFLRQRRWLA